MSNLKPCPFCGSENVYMAREWDECMDRTIRYIECRECRAKSGSKSHAKGDDCPNFYAEVREQWNQRSSEKGES